MKNKPIRYKWRGDSYVLPVLTQLEAETIAHEHTGWGEMLTRLGVNERRAGRIQPGLLEAQQHQNPHRGGRAPEMKACSCHFLTNAHGYVGLLHLETSAVHPLWCCDHFGAKIKLCNIWTTVNNVLSNPKDHEWVTREIFSGMK